jgi:hypothetical protein
MKALEAVQQPPDPSSKDALDSPFFEMLTKQHRLEDTMAQTLIYSLCMSARHHQGDACIRLLNS